MFFPHLEAVRQQDTMVRHLNSGYFRAAALLWLAIVPNALLLDDLLISYLVSNLLFGAV